MDELKPMEKVERLVETLMGADRGPGPEAAAALAFGEAFEALFEEAMEEAVESPEFEEAVDEAADNAVERYFGREGSFDVTDHLDGVYLLGYLDEDDLERKVEQLGFVKQDDVDEFVSKKRVEEMLASLDERVEGVEDGLRECANEVEQLNNHPALELMSALNVPGPRGVWVRLRWILTGR